MELDPGTVEGREGLRKLCEAATKGPMQIVERLDDDGRSEEWYWISHTATAMDNPNVQWDSTLIERREDAEFYATVRTALPLALAHIESLTTERDTLRREVEAWRYAAKPGLGMEQLDANARVYEAIAATDALPALPGGARGAEGDKPK